LVANVQRLPPMKMATHACGLILLTAVAACTTGEAASSSGGPEPSVTASAAPGLDPSLAPAPVHATHAPVTGTVAETMDAASYTYVRLTTPQGDQWAAIPQAKLAVGDTVTIVNPMVMDAFQSPSLKRTFDHILFGTLAGKAPPPAPSGDPHAGMLPGALASSGPPPGSPVPKATGPNAHTIAEVLAAKATLKDKPVTVRGRVTKYNAAILGKNWLHLDDGSGKAPDDGTIVVTTGATANVGDVVVVQGVVRTDKDFGAGYSYAVMIEEATVTK
jgi:hypothetical protein